MRRDTERIAAPDGNRLEAWPGIVRMQGFAARSERPRWPFDAEDQLRFQRNAL
jgi:hypothetical protein